MRCGSPRISPVRGLRGFDRTPDPGPGVVALEHRSKVEHPVEVLDLVRGLANQEPDGDTAEVGRAFDAPVEQDGARRQPELLQREIAARPCQVGARDMSSNAGLALRVLQRGEHEQIRALVIPAVEGANPLEYRLRQFEVVHQPGSLSLAPWSARSGLLRGGGERGWVPGARVRGAPPLETRIVCGRARNC